MISILSLDTTSKFASISVSRGEEVFLEYNFATQDDLSSTLIPALEFVLNSASIKLQEIDLFGIGVGPGLFTGIRVGLSTLKGLLMNNRKPVVPVVTLEALAYKCSDTGAPIVSLRDARRKEVYAAVYSFSGDRPEEILPPVLLPLEGLIDHLAGLKEFHFVGSGADVYREFLDTHFKGRSICRRSYFLAPEMCRIAFHRYQEKEFITDLSQLLPLYIRKPDAEQNLLNKQSPGSGL
jgi:tRNA threonylcarbamoyladenosine biosynthesis protein TsaB